MGRRRGVFVSMDLLVMRMWLVGWLVVWMLMPGLGGPGCLWVDWCGCIRRFGGYHCGGRVELSWGSLLECH